MTDTEVRALVTTLVADGDPAGMKAAPTIAHALENGAVLVALDEADRDILLAVLEDPPDSLAELRGALAKDVSWRHR